MDPRLTMRSEIAVFQSIKEVHWGHCGGARWQQIATGGVRRVLLRGQVDVSGSGRGG